MDNLTKIINRHNFIKLIALFVYSLLIYSVYDYNLEIYSREDLPNPHNYTFIVNPGASVCGESAQILCVVFVIVKPDDFVTRDKIRSSWANKTQFPSLKVIFSLGLSVDEEINQKVLNESRMHNDIIQEDFVDSYKNLTVKIIMSFKWVKLYCPQAEYVIRVNHHVVMNTYAMIKFLEIQRDSYFRTNNYFMGTVLEQTPPIRDRSHKFFVSKSSFKRNTYDPYMEGTGYILTGDAAIAFYEESLKLYWPPFSVWLDDVYMGILAKRLKTELIDISKYFIPKDQYGDVTIPGILSLLSKRKSFSTLFIISNEDPLFYWKFLNIEMNSKFEFRE